MFTKTLSLLLLFWGQDTVWSVRLIEVRVPAHAREGGIALLSCQYDMEGDRLYSVKWYKGEKEREFYRYVPKPHSTISAFNVSGVHVDVAKSSDTNVVLQNLSRESEGNYVCEVSGEAPTFTTARNSKYITMHLIPESGPHVTGLKDQYYLDEHAVVNCTSSASRPLAQLAWLVNDHPASKVDLQGPWHRVSQERPDAVETTLQLNFIVAPRHFVNGVLKLKCQATIAPLYMSETNSTHYIGLSFTRIPSDQGVSAGHTSSSQAKYTKASVFLLSALPLIMLQIV